jgi:hypothetical protein
MRNKLVKKPIILKLANRHDLVNYCSVIGMLCSTTVSTVRPGPKPKSTPHSSPSPVVALPSSADRRLISSKMNNTQALDMFPYSLRMCLVSRIFSFFSASLASTWSRIAGPPGCAIQKMEFQSLMPDEQMHIKCQKML